MKPKMEVGGRAMIAATAALAVSAWLGVAARLGDVDGFQHYPAVGAPPEATADPPPTPDPPQPELISTPPWPAAAVVADAPQPAAASNQQTTRESPSRSQSSAPNLSKAMGAPSSVSPQQAPEDDRHVRQPERESSAHTIDNDRSAGHRDESIDDHNEEQPALKDTNDIHPSDPPDVDIEIERPADWDDAHDWPDKDEFLDPGWNPVTPSDPDPDEQSDEQHTSSSDHSSASFAPEDDSSP
jgi:hypothetical protein